MEFWELRQMRNLPLDMKLWTYCVYTLGLKDVLEYIGIFYGGDEKS
jgi:hypothetical protein